MAKFTIAEMGVESGRVEVRFSNGVTYTAEIVSTDRFPARGAVEVAAEVVQREPWPAFGEPGETTLTVRLSGWAKVNEVSQ